MSSEFPNNDYQGWGEDINDSADYEAGVYDDVKDRLGAQALGAAEGEKYGNDDYSREDIDRIVDEMDATPLNEAEVNRIMDKMDATPLEKGGEQAS